MITFILNLFPQYRKLVKQQKKFQSLLFDCEFRVSELEKRMIAHDYRFDFLDNKVQEIDNYIFTIEDF